MARIIELKGNLFESSCQTLVNTVNCVGVMGKGIAFEFKHRYPAMYAAYTEICAQGGLRPGLLQLWTRQRPWVLNFPTKDHWRQPSRLEFIASGLRKFAGSYAARGITSIAFPRLGTANGGLDWADVRPVMLGTLEPLPGLDVEIYEFDPHAPDDLFARLRQRVARFDLEDWKRHLGIGAKPARTLQEAIASGVAERMTDLEQLKGIGEVTFDRLFDFAMSEARPLPTANEVQPRLF